MTAPRSTLMPSSAIRRPRPACGTFSRCSTRCSPVATGDVDFASFNNDCITRCLAAVSRLDRPIFIKAAYNGPRATEDTCRHDPDNLIFGVLGGGAGTTRDCLELIHQAERYGARVALFGRKIYGSENSVLMLTAMRRVIEDRIGSDEGVRACHADLARAGITAFWRQGPGAWTAI